MTNTRPPAADTIAEAGRAGAEDRPAALQPTARRAPAIDHLSSFRVAHVALACVDRELRLLAVNPAWTALLGAEARSLLALVHPDDHAGVTTSLAAAGPHPRDFAARLLLRDGTWRPLQLRCARGEAASGDVHLSARELDTSSVELDRAERLLTATLETMQDCVLMVDERGIIEGINRAPDGLTTADILGVPVLAFAPPDQHVPMQERIEAVREHRVCIAYETEAAYPDGSLHSFSSRLGPILDGDRCVGVMLVTRDISALRRAEQAQRRAELLLEEKLRDLHVANQELTVVHARILADEQRERTRLANELDVAHRIQAGMLPHDLAVPGLDIAAAMHPCAEMGGDYYDVRRDGAGCWIAIGDVAGHGVSAGLVMLMIQCITATLTQTGYSRAPSTILARTNAILHEIIRARLASDDHITGSLLRFYSDGRVVFAGAHEDILVLRARTGVCERIETTGVWLGVLPDIRRQTRDHEFRLEPGDTVLLYTDGLTEALAGDHQQFGLERVIAHLERAAPGPARSVLDGLLAELHGFCRSPGDDVTVMVVRYTGPAPV